ncbi:MAG: helix-turn-helix transcriptional regulator [Victivallales bacterium]|nr:helix-turn-helix transcriptional regulator [Victivallales bacterium]
MTIPEKQPQGVNLSELDVVTNSHPHLTLAHPFQMHWNVHGPESFYRADVHYALQMSVVRHGEIEINFENFHRICHAGDMWWTFCWEPHAYRALGRRNLLVTFTINLDDLGEIGVLGSSINWLAPFSDTPDKRYTPRTQAERNRIRQLITRMLHMYRQQPANWQTQCWLYFHCLLLYVIEHMPETTATPRNAPEIRGFLERLRPALELVRTSPVTPDLKSAASVCHLSVSRFSELFRKALGQSYGHFALRAKLGHCAADLKNGRLLLKEIAQRHGFCDAASLCKAFRRVFHCTPTEFKA